MKLPLLSGRQVHFAAVGAGLQCGVAFDACIASSRALRRSSLPVPRRARRPCGRTGRRAASRGSAGRICASFSRHGCQLFVGQLVQHDQALAFLFVRHAGDDERLLGRAGQFVQFFLDLDVRHHFAADFAEAAQAVGDLQEAVLVHRRDVAGDIPAVAQDLGGLFRAGRGSPASRSGRARASGRAGRRGSLPLHGSSGSTMRTLTPGSGWPILPRLAPTCRKPAERKSCVLTATAGAHSVQP